MTKKKETIIIIANTKEDLQAIRNLSLASSDILKIKAPDKPELRALEELEIARPAVKKKRGRYWDSPKFRFKKR